MELALIITVGVVGMALFAAILIHAKVTKELKGEIRDIGFTLCLLRSTIEDREQDKTKG